MLSHLVVSETLWPHGHMEELIRLLCTWGFSRQEYWSGLPHTSRGDLPSQEWNLGLQHCRQILYHLSQQWSPLKRMCNDIIIPVFPEFVNKSDKIIFTWKCNRYDFESYESYDLLKAFYNLRKLKKVNMHLMTNKYYYMFSVPWFQQNW